jgi:mono/diheme cytochrome c family protein
VSNVEQSDEVNGRKLSAAMWNSLFAMPFEADISNRMETQTMKRATMQVFATAIAVLFFLPLAASAQDGQTLYKGKCAMCHGADGTKIAIHNLSATTTQGMSDSDLSGIIANGKGKMPASKSLTPDQVTGLVAYVRTLKK